jgi:serine/threonine protein kinase
VRNKTAHKFDLHYRLGDELGQGAFSLVRLATNRATNDKVAIKIVDRKNLPADDEESLRSEVEILQKMNHPNIVRCFDFFEEEKNFYVVMEYLDGGELFDRIVKKTCYNEKEARDLVATLLKAIKHCHDNDVVHRYYKLSFGCMELTLHNGTSFFTTVNC